MTGHAEKAAIFVADEGRAHWHDQALWFVRLKRDRQAESIPEWEALREAAAAIKAHTLSRIADYLEEFERNARTNGIQVHWARDGAKHNAIVHRILADRGLTRLVKSKSMLTEECHLNPYLEARGIEVTDTDLGERIVQLRHEPPSHIVLPAIHLKKEDIGDLFHKELGTAEGASDPSTSPRRRAPICGRSSWQRKRASPASTSRSPKPAASSSAPMKATPTWERACPR